MLSSAAPPCGTSREGKQCLLEFALPGKRLGELYVIQQHHTLVYPLESSNHAFTMEAPPHGNHGRVHQKPLAQRGWPGNSGTQSLDGLPNMHTRSG